MNGSVSVQVVRRAGYSRFVGSGATGGCNRKFGGDPEAVFDLKQQPADFRFLHRFLFKTESHAIAPEAIVETLAANDAGTDFIDVDVEYADVHADLLADFEWLVGSKLQSGKAEVETLGRRINTQNALDARPCNRQLKIRLIAGMAPSFLFHLSCAFW